MNKISPIHHSIGHITGHLPVRIDLDSPLSRLLTQIGLSWNITVK